MHSDSSQQPGTPRPTNTPSFSAYPTQLSPPSHGPYPDGFTPQPAPPAKPSQGKKWLTHGAVGLVALFLGVGIGVSDDQAQATDSAEPPRRSP
ncbi:hypothetical protein [Streptomyces sp. NPDC058463]|uniref:hypothetical protein n=1 Tax=Streptomyces sp. NPDC058463 TaxID=3346510 RepID=UPI00365C0DBC